MKLIVGVLFALVLIQVSTASLLSARITDAHNAEPGQFPYQVSIELKMPFSKYKHVCGGSIISENYILTAGHCAKGFIYFISNMRIKAGKHYLDKDDEHVQTIMVSKRIPHKSFPGGMTPKQHDIALLKLSKPLVFNARVQPIQLPKQDAEQSGFAFLSGWGSVSKKIFPQMPKSLQYASLPILEQDVCKKFYDSANPGIMDTMICTGPVGSSVSACSGDSGSPLAQYVDGKPVMVGVVSWGSYPCGRGAPSVYTRVASYVNWINEVTLTV